MGIRARPWYVRWRGGSRRWTTAGVALLSLMLGLVIMEIVAGLALPDWQMWAQRERELELLWRGCQYVRAIEAFHRRCGRLPWSIDELLDTNKIPIGTCPAAPNRQGFPPRFLRRAYQEPFREAWQFICQDPDPNRTCPDNNPQNPNPIKGVRSLDSGEAIIAFDQKTRHDEWQFVYEAGAPPTAVHPCMTIPLE